MWEQLSTNYWPSGPGLPRLGRHYRLPSAWTVLEPLSNKNKNKDMQTIYRILILSRVAIESERHWTGLDLGAGILVWSLEHQTPSAFFRGAPLCALFPTRRRSKASTRSRGPTRACSGGRNSSVRTSAPWSIARAVSANASAEFFLRLPLPPTGRARNGCIG